MSSQLRKPELPLDIVHAILERLSLEQDLDVDVLYACTLVCRNWLPVARKYLFARVTIKSRDDGLDAYRHTPWYVSSAHGIPDANSLPDGREVFHDQFTKPLCVTPAYVTDLYLTGTSSSKLDSHKLAPLLASFPLLKHLRICSWDIAAVEKAQLPSPYPPSLEVLQLRNLMRYPPSPWDHPEFIPQRFLDLLHHFPEAKSIIFHHLPFSVDANSENFDFSHLDIPASFTPSSVSLWADTSDSAFLLNLLRHAPSTPSALRTLRVAFRQLIFVAPSMARLLNTTRCLEVLKIDVSSAGCFTGSGYDLTHDTRALQSVKDHLSPIIRSLASLRTLVLTAPIATSKYWPLCVEVLSSLPVSVRHVELRMYSHSPMELPLEQLDDRLSGVEVARVVLWGCLFEDEEDDRRVAWSEYLHRGLPDLTRRNILQVWFSYYQE